MISVLLVEDSPDQVLFIQHVLGQNEDLQVTHTADGAAAEELAKTKDWDLVISDIELPGLTGLQLLEIIKDRSPETPVILITGHERMDYAMGAFKYNADGMLLKPLNANELMDKVKEVLAKSQKTKSDPAVVLAIGAHPDDVEIGCGGTLIRHSSSGDKVTVLTLSGGEHGGEPGKRVKESERAAEILGADLIMGSLQDTKISEGLDTIKLIEGAISKVNPDIVYTHTEKDGHQDHRNGYRASIVACRSIENIYSYQAPSTNIDFRPNHFVDVGDYLNEKIDSIEAYQTQTAIRSYLAEDLIRATSRYWGRFAGYSFVEPFEIVRQKQSS